MHKRGDYQRQVKEGSITITTFTKDDIGADPLPWLECQAHLGMKLLLHTDEIVLWGHYGEDGFEFPSQDLYAHGKLRSFAIQSIRLFDKNQEIYLWQIAENQWQARTVTDVTEGTDRATQKEPAICHRLDEEQVLWGTRVEANADGFCRVADGQQGLVHALPLNLSIQDWSEPDGAPQRDLRLKIRHYLEEDEMTGWLRIVFSRLVDLYQFSQKNGDNGAPQATQNSDNTNQEPRGEA